jgi:hypothetical protein
MKQLNKVRCKSKAECETCKFQISSTSNDVKERIHIKITLIYRGRLVNVKPRLAHAIFSYQEETSSIERQENLASRMRMYFTALTMFRFLNKLRLFKSVIRDHKESEFAENVGVLKQKGMYVF